jgi:hypothetical protein
MVSHGRLARGGATDNGIADSVTFATDEAFTRRSGGGLVPSATRFFPRAAGEARARLARVRPSRITPQG